MLKLAVIGGDGTGPEVVREGLKVLAAVSKLEKLDYDAQHFDFGGDRYLKSGEIISETGSLPSCGKVLSADSSRQLVIIVSSRTSVFLR